jgi:hypothetical protein
MAIEFYGLKKLWQICGVGVFFKTFEADFGIFPAALSYFGA